MDTCFVIQPFDRDQFDRRYEETYKPAIEAAKLKPYRVDQDPFVRVPIENIEEGIRNAAICLADISADNPNVWYELGFAFASNKDVVMICSEGRTANNFPFDVRHKNIITYKTGSPSDFTSLKEKITERLNAYIQQKGRVKKILETPVKANEGLKLHELTMLIIIFGHQTTPSDTVPIHLLQNDMGKAGFNSIAINLAIRQLKRKGLIDFSIDFDPNNNYEYKAVILTEKGDDWILSNQDKINVQTPEDDDDLPF